MGLLKKNLIFFIVIVLCLAAFGVGAYLTYTQYQAAIKAEGHLANVESQLRALLQQDPAPAAANVAAAEENLRQLTASLAQIRDQLQAQTPLDTSADGVSVIAGIQQYITNFQLLTARHKNADGDAVAIQTPDNFAFGFEQYITEGQVPADAARASQLDKQRQILSYLLTQLIASDPHSIEAVSREVLEAGPAAEQKGFEIAPDISARVPGAIDTMAFSLTFRGYTDSLRRFLNRLARFELPIVVRSIQVSRPAVAKKPAANKRGNPATSFFDIFGQEEAAGATPAAGAVADTAAVEQKPVIEENVSEFTIILEFIEVILPEANSRELSDPA